MKKLYLAYQHTFLLLTLGMAVSVAQAQNVGIGSSTPGEKLDVNGAIKVGNTSGSNAGSIRYVSGSQRFQVNIAGTWYDIATGNLAYITNFSYNTVTNELTITEGSTVHTVDLDDLQDNTDDQVLTLSGNNLSIEDGNTISLAAYMDNTDNQALSYNTSSNILTLQNGGTVDLTDLQDNTDNQTLSITSNNLAISGGNSVSLLPYLDNTDSQQLTLSSNNLTISGGNSVSLAGYVNTDNQTLSLSGNTLAITGGNNVSLAGYVNTDAQTLSLSGSNLSISGGNTLSMAAFLDNTDSQTLSLSGNNLSISDGNAINLGAYVNTDDQALTYNSITNVLSLEDGGTVNLSDLQDNTDDQNLTLAGNTLSIESGNSVDLSGFADNTDEQTLSEVYLEGGNTVQLNATNGDVRFFRGPSTEVLNLKESNGFMGVGTTNPTYKLDVTGEIRATTYINTETHFVGIGSDPYYRTNTNSKHIVLSGGSGWTSTGATMVLRGASASSNAHGLEMYTGNSERMRIISNGNVGIGSTAPVGNLDVNTAGTGGWNKFVVKNTSLWGDGLSSPSETGGTPYVTIGAQASGIMIFNPHVVWNNAQGAAAIRYGRSGGVSSGQYWEAGVNGNAGFHIRRNATANTGIEITSGGNIGLGTTAPAQLLELYRENLDVGIRFHDPGDYHYAAGIDRSDGGKFKINYGAGVGDANHIVLTSGGSVGIGSNNPAQNLDVAGDINTSSGYRVGNGAPSGQYLRGNGTRFVSSAIQPGDLPSNSGAYIQNQYSSGQSGNHWITGIGRADASFRAPSFRVSDYNLGSLPAGDGNFYRYGGQTEISIDDWMYIRDANDNAIRISMNSDDGSIRPQIMYDINDVNYYVDPNSTSRMYRVGFNGQNTINSGLYVWSYGDGNHVIYSCAPGQDGGARQAGYWNSGHRMRFRTYGSGQGFLFENSNNVSLVDITADNGGGMWVQGQIRTPVYYDSDNTNYYINAAGYSNLNQLNISRDGASACCGGSDYTLSLAETTSSSGRRAQIQFHNGGYAEGFIRLEGGGGYLRKFRFGDYQGNNTSIVAQTGVVNSRAIAVTNYQLVQGPGTGSDNTWHTIQCSGGYAMVNFSVYSGDRWDGDLRTNCADLSPILTTSGWYWQDSNNGGNNWDNRDYIINCPNNYLASGFQMYATSRLDYYSRLLCAPLTNQATVAQYPGFETALLGPWNTGGDNTTHFAQCPAGTYVNGMTYYASNYADGALRLRCTGLNLN